ncbi:hypothetical protein AQUCO_07800017v1 [Aquilegia coerulea]|uniref:Uncharacterized protein n=1 Tax=Aquilegia coerulea TaxID=218851 RepID=A0A2G5C7W1_AQUCA|nr:hypothetical protein AQUCO_07800017v1 [Aquilegia coerulea]
MKFLYSEIRILKVLTMKLMITKWTWKLTWSGRRVGLTNDSMAACWENLDMLSRDVFPTVHLQVPHESSNGALYLGEMVEEKEVRRIGERLTSNSRAGCTDDLDIPARDVIPSVHPQPPIKTNIAALYLNHVRREQCDNFDAPPGLLRALDPPGFSMSIKPQNGDSLFKQVKRELQLDYFDTPPGF